MFTTRFHISKGVSSVIGTLIMVAIVVAAVGVGGTFYLQEYASTEEVPVATVDYEQTTNNQIENRNDPDSEFVEETDVINISVTSMERADELTVIHNRTGTQLTTLQNVGDKTQVGITTENQERDVIEDGEIVGYTGDNYDNEEKLEDGDIIYTIAEYNENEIVLSTFTYIEERN